MLTVLLVGAWIGCVVLLLPVTGPGMDVTPAYGVLLLVLMIALPALAGSLVGGWRAASANRVNTLHSRARPA